jgi:hypothetical protein
MPLILGANSLTGGYEVDNSLRFNSGSSDNLTRTPATAGNRQKFTISVWVKRSILATTQQIIVAHPTLYAFLRFQTDDKLYFYGDDATLYRATTQVFRDVSAWYHIITAVDTTLATANDRVKMYVNGVQITSFDTTVNPSQNALLNFNNATQHWIGCFVDTTQVFNGYMSEFYMIDGQQLDPDDFGEFDSDTNIWKPIPYAGTYGTNGFYLEFKDSSALGDDTSGNGNDFTVNNLTSIDQTTDTPTNNFATLNPTGSGAVTFAEGNLQASRASGPGWLNAISGFGVSSGKWYAELKVNSVGTNGLNMGYINLDKSNLQNLTVSPGEDAFSAGLYSNGGPIFYASGTTFATVGSPIATDIMQFAMDIDNGFLYWGKNGTWLNSADPESGGLGTGGLDLSNLSLGGTYTLAVACRNGGDVSYNFGNAPFTISSGNSDANGIGNFEYAVPSGYFALCTKNLAQYG